MLQKSKSRKGSSAIEWALLASLLASVSVSVLVKGGAIAPDAFLRFADNLDQESQAGSDHSSAADGDKCYIGSDRDDTLTADPDINCYKLLAGSDNFSGAASAAPLFVDAGSGGTVLTSITTGSGNDHIISQQSGAILTGPGDDTIELTFDSRGRFDLNPGSGRDEILILAKNPPKGAAQNKISSGTGDLWANITCESEPILITLLPGSSTYLTGKCPIDLVADNRRGPRQISADVSSLNARIDAASGLVMNISAGQEAPAKQTQGLYLSNWADSSISYASQSLSQADFIISGVEPEPSGMVEVDLKAPHGNVSLDGVGRHSWTITANYIQTGQISLSFPDEAGFQQMQAPKLLGRAKTLRIAGCFEELTVKRGTEVLWRPNPCSSGSTSSYQLSQEGEGAVLELARGHDRERIALGPNHIAIQSITVSP